MDTGGTQQLESLSCGRDYHRPPRFMDHIFPETIISYILLYKNIAYNIAGNKRYTPKKNLFLSPQYFGKNLPR